MGQGKSASKRGTSSTGAVLLKYLVLNYWIILNWTFIKPRRLNRHNYRRFLEANFTFLLKDVSIILRIRTWFMHDGATAHCSALARENLT